MFPEHFAGNAVKSFSDSKKIEKPKMICDICFGVSRGKWKKKI